MSLARKTKVSSMPSICLDNIDESFPLSSEARYNEKPIQLNKKEEEIIHQPCSNLEASSSLNTDKLCRICFDVETQIPTLINPCKCSGSIKWVHEECLKTWILGNRDELVGSSCELCSHEYKMNLEVKSEFNYKEACKSSLVKFLFTPLLGAVLMMLALIIYLLIIKYEDPESSQEEKSYSIGIAVACSLAFSVISYMIIRWFLQSCVRTIIKAWRIMNYEENSVNLSNIDFKPNSDEIHNTTTVQPEDIFNRIPDTSVMIIPSEIRVNGRTVISPSVSPPFLTPMNRNGSTVAYRNNFIQSLLSSSENTFRVQAINHPHRDSEEKASSSINSPDYSLRLARITVPGRTPILGGVLPNGIKVSPVKEN